MFQHCLAFELWHRAWHPVRQPRYILARLVCYSVQVKSFVRPTSQKAFGFQSKKIRCRSAHLLAEVASSQWLLKQLQSAPVHRVHIITI